MLVEDGLRVRVEVTGMERRGGEEVERGKRREGKNEGGEGGGREG